MELSLIMILLAHFRSTQSETKILVKHILYMYIVYVYGKYNRLFKSSKALIFLDFLNYLFISCALNNYLQFNFIGISVTNQYFLLKLSHTSNQQFDILTL